MKKLQARRLSLLTLAIIVASVLGLLLTTTTRRVRAATITVTNNNDSGAGSLRQAISDAMAGDTINFSLSYPATITLTSGEIVFNKSLTINGPGAENLTVSGNNASRIFRIAAGHTVVINGLTIANGAGSNTDGGTSGGAIRNRSTLTINDCVFSNNSTPLEGAAIFNFAGATLTINNSTFMLNFASGGGAIASRGGTLIVNNSTISGNMAGDFGGGIFSYFQNSVTLTNCTITGNRCNISSSSGSGGGIRTEDADTFTNTIIAGNFSGTGTTPNEINTAGGGIDNARHNIIGAAASSGGIQNGVNGNIVGVNINSVLNTTLADNGGPTPTHALICGSPAIDGGDNSFATAADQRGFLRPFDGNGDSTATTDIGAFEQHNVCPKITVQPLSLQRGDSVNSMLIANVTDVQDLEQNLVVSVNSPLNNVTISNVGIAANGDVTANLAAACNATTASFTLSATDSFPQTAAATLLVNVTNSDAPSFTHCPANITTSTTAGQCSQIVSFTPTATDDCSGSITPVCTPASGSTFQKGTTTVTCTAKDADNQTTTCSFTVTVQDSQSPTINCPANITQATGASQCAATVTYSATASDLCDGSITPVCTPASGSTFQKGTTTVTCTATDTASNQSNCSFTVTVNDTIAPTIACANVAAQSASTGANCTATVPDVRTLVRAQSTDNCTAIADLIITQSPTEGSSVSGSGSHPITVTVKDADNNSKTCIVAFTVNDTTAPTINCPANITRGTDPNQCAATVSFAPTANDNCSGVGTPTCTPPSGSSFPKGTTTVTCTVKDAANNQSAPCSFTVTINDTQPPNIAPLTNISVPATTGLCSAVVSFAVPAVSDNCPGVGTPICMPPSGTSFPKGTTTVTCTVKDAANNSASSLFTVTVVDMQPPTIICPPNVITATVNPGDTAVAVSFATPSTTDNCGSVNVVCAPPSGAQFPRGVTTVTCTATDAASNQTSCTFTVTVFDYVIVDDTNGKLLRFVSTTGDYDFFDCRKNKSVNGRGVVTMSSCKTELRDIEPDRTVTVLVNPCTKAGNATVIYAGTTHTLTDANLSNNISRCP
jgi:hypothetical protein